MNQGPDQPTSEATEGDASRFPPPFSPSAPTDGTPTGPAPDVWVRYDARANTPLPVKQLGRYWHAGTHYRLSEEEAAQLADVPGFVRFEPEEE